MSRRPAAIGALVALAVFAADQGSKYWILHRLDLPRRRDVKVMPHLDLTMVWNRGITFGLLTGHGAWDAAILAVLALAIVAALGVWLWRAASVRQAMAIGAIAGGAVVDFIRVHAFGWSWYVFNLGDAAIVCGVAALVLLGSGRRVDST